MVRPLVIALLASSAAAADTTSLSGTAEPSSAPVDATGITSQTSAATVLPNMSTARIGHTATLLAGGQVLIAGGSPTYITAELYEPAQGAFRPIADMRYGRRGHTATLLSSGSVLIAGGEDQSGSPLSAAELFIPASAAFTPIHPMTTARVGSTATLLKTNQVLITGGWNTANGVVTAISSAEIFNPTTRTFTRTGAMNHPRAGHADVLLTDGRVLIVGGAANTAEIYDPKTGRFSPTGSMLQSRVEFTATLISGGNVLITGGQSGSYPLSSAEIYEPASGRFFAIQPMAYARADHTATALTDGTVLVSGGARQFAENPMGCFPIYFFWENGSVERFNPATRQFTVVSADFMSVPRGGHTATRLPTGDVLVTGGTTLVNELCGMVGLRRIFKEVPTLTAAAELIR